MEDINRFLDEGVPESERLDYKADPHIWQEPGAALLDLQRIVAKAVSAFANSGGGTLLLGVSEGPNGEPVRTEPPGLPAQIGRDPVVERVDRIITRCIFPRPPAMTHPVVIPGMHRAYVVVDIPPRGAGPYRVVDTKDPGLDDRYFVRQGRSSVVADHHQLRQLFAEAAEGGLRVREYLGSQKLGDLEDPFFGRRPPAGLLSVDARGRAEGAVIITMIPEVLRGAIIDPDDERVRKLLSTSGAASRFGHEERPTLEGRAIEETHRPPPLLRSYLHFHRNGYLEVGHAAAFEVTDHGKYVLADAVEAMLNPLLPLAKSLYDLVETRDRIFVSIHIRDAADTRLGAHITGGGISGSGYCTLPRMSVSSSFTVAELGLARTRAVLDRRLANAYGIEEGLILNLDGTEKPRRFFV